MAVPEPNSPEALRAAQKVRNVFYMIAAANIVLIAIVMWPRPEVPEAAKSPAVSVPFQPETDASAMDPVVAQMEAVLDRLLAAYHGRDAERFAAEFATTANPKPDEEYFRTVVVERYADQFGELTDKKRTADTTPTPDGGVLGSEFNSKKAGIVKSRVTFVREAGKLRVANWELEKTR